MAVSASLGSAQCACAFKPARSAGRVQRQPRLQVTAQAVQEVNCVDRGAQVVLLSESAAHVMMLQNGRKKALVAGLALVASVPLVFSGRNWQATTCRHVAIQRSTPFACKCRARKRVCRQYSKGFRREGRFYHCVHPLVCELQLNECVCHGMHACTCFPLIRNGRLVTILCRLTDTHQVLAVSQT